MSMEKRLLRISGVAPGVCAKLLGKSRELKRSFDMRFSGGALGLGEDQAIVLCFELACKLLHIPLDRNQSRKLSGLSVQAYLRSYNSITNALGLRPKTSIQDLAALFGCVRIVATVHRNLGIYQKKYIADLPDSRKAAADFTHPVFTAATFYLTAKNQQLRVERSKLLNEAGVTEQQFMTTLNSMEHLCPELFGGRRSGRQGGDPKRSREESDDSGCDDDIDDEDGLVVPGVKRSAKRVFRAEYEEWKASVVKVKADASRPAGAEDKSRRQQSTLSSFFKRNDANRP